MTCHVYRTHAIPDCTRQGVTATVDRVTLIGLDVPEISEPTAEAPAVFIQRRDGMRPIAAPAGLEGRAMFGGNFIYSSDSRFAALTTDGGPIAVHDRVESNTLAIPSAFDVGLKISKHCLLSILREASTFPWWSKIRLGPSGVSFEWRDDDDSSEVKSGFLNVDNMSFATTELMRQGLPVVFDDDGDWWAGQQDLADRWLQYAAFGKLIYS